MKIRFLALAATLAAGLAAAPALAGDALPDLGGQTIHAVTENAYTPLNFADPKTGEGIGWEYDAINEIGKRLNAKIEWNLSSWDVMIQAVHDGQYDIGMDGISITDERKQQVDFSDPYMDNQQFMLVRADEDRIKPTRRFRRQHRSLDRRAGRHLGLLRRRSTTSSTATRPRSARVKLFDTFGASVQALKSGDVDMVLMDQASVDGYIAADPGRVQDRRRADRLGPVRLHPAARAPTSARAGQRRASPRMKADGTSTRLNRKWFFEYSAAK